MQKRPQTPLEKATALNERFDRALASLSARPAHEQQQQPAKRRNIIPAIILGFIGFVLVVGMSTDTEARRRVRIIEISKCVPDDRYACNISVVGKPYRFFEPLLPQHHRKWKVTKRKPATRVVKKEQPAKAGTIAAYQEKLYREAKGVSLRGVVKVLANKAREISAKCGSRVTSAVRRGALVCGGYGCSTSNHALGKAVDMQGNPRCAYALLRKWPGGVSTDYSRMRHVHISYNPRGKEWGARFAHNGYSTRRTRLARYRG